MTRIIRFGIASFAALVVACSPSGLLEVETPDIIDPSVVTTPQGVAALHAGALGEFSFAFVGNAGGTEGQIQVSGSFTDELGNSETFPTRREYDTRGPIDLRNGTLSGVFRNLQRARRLSEVAAEAIGSVAANPTDSTRVAETYALAGFTYVSMGENYCSGVPISEAAIDGTLTFGDPLTTTELFERAIERFDAALAWSKSATITNLAKIGKARAQLNLNRAADASATVAGIATTFSYNITHTLALGRQQNGIFAFINQFERFSVANNDGGNGLNFRTAQDPRVPWLRIPANDVGFDAATPQYDQGKYASETAPTPLATGVEARLIEAENLLRTGGAWLGTLNTLRGTPGLTPTVFPTGWPSTFGFPALQSLADPGTQTAREDLLFRERAFWMYLSGHRLGDLRRLVRQYGRSANAVFPGGGGAPYIIDGNNKGGVFGNEVNLPIPFDELNNPNFTQCINRDP
ncbi:MAG: hypothetical protein ACT4PM_11830 [Gemmatimonadales bacterium]